MIISALDDGHSLPIDQLNTRLGDDLPDGMDGARTELGRYFTWGNGK
jgi:hypothetical protein